MIIYELLTGSAPFRRDTTWAALDATVHHAPPLPSVLNPIVPAGLAALVSRCLSKDPDQRPASGETQHRELIAIQRERAPVAADKSRWYRRAAVLAAVLIALVSLGAFAWSRVRENRLRWVRDTAIPEMNRLALAGDSVGAYRVGLRARAMLPDDPQLDAAWQRFAQETAVTSDPPGCGSRYPVAGTGRRGLDRAGYDPAHDEGAGRANALAVYANRARSARDHS